MKQLLQNMRDGKAEVVDVPIPQVKPGYVLVKNQASVVSAGTERMVVEFAEKSLVGKAQSRPDLVKQVMDKARREGVIPTVQSAFNRLDQPMALGYSSAGIAIAVGDAVTDIKPGMHVACAGGGFAAHAEYVLVPKNLVVPVPLHVPFEEAAFTTVAAVSLQGFRLAEVQVGEKIAIIGLGLLGLLMVGIAKAAGCQVFGTDLDSNKVDLARKMGAHAVQRDLVESEVVAFTNNRGFDAVFICADTKSNDPVELAGLIAKDRGTVVAVGAVGMEIPRKIYYEKELSFLISRSYGPGRYDPGYEEGGIDYPYGYVRWTEGRNLQAIIDLIANGNLNVKQLITHRFPIVEGVKAYEIITGKYEETFLGVVIEYPQPDEIEYQSIDRSQVVLNSKSKIVSEIKIGVLGAGNYATAVFLPIIQKTGNVETIGICSAKGLTARHAGKKFGFQFACTNENEILENETINTIVLLTRHDTHASQVIKSIQNQKHVYCEKPLAINHEELDLVEASLKTANSVVTVGFNRRFAPLARQLKSFIAKSSEPKRMHYRVNAGLLPGNHWLHDPLQGGGRIIGEGCHFIDFLVFLMDSVPVSVRSFGMPDIGKYHEDNVVMVFTFEDGSIGTVEYLANGDKSVPKEEVEVFSGGLVGKLHDFRELNLVQNGSTRVIKNRMKQDKGHQNAWSAFLESIKKSGSLPIPYDQLIGVTRTSFKAVESLRQKKELEI